MINNDTIPLSDQDTINWIKNQNKQKIKQEPTKVNNETNAPTVYGKYVDKCLNEVAKHFFSKGEDKYSVADLFYAGVRCEESWIRNNMDKSLLTMRTPIFNKRTLHQNKNQNSR